VVYHSVVGVVRVVGFIYLCVCVDAFIYVSKFFCFLSLLGVRDCRVRDKA
jgi:hypothetical protein